MIRNSGGVLVDPPVSKEDFGRIIAHYLEHQGGLQFESSTFDESTAGRWLSLDAGDVDGDGDMDIGLVTEPGPRGAARQK